MTAPSDGVTDAGREGKAGKRENGRAEGLRELLGSKQAMGGRKGRRKGQEGRM